MVFLTQNAAVTFATNDSLAGTTPNSSGYKFKIFVGAASGGATAIMYVGSETTYGTGLIPYNTAFSILAPPTSGTSIAGSDIPATGVGAHFSWVFGKEAFTVVDLQALQSYVTKKEATDSDPLAQRRKAGWKTMFKAVINNQDFLERIESSSAFY